jgi:hypothetical protein
MAFLLTPTRHELLQALWSPALMTLFLLVYIRYRMLTWDVSSANRRDGVDYSPEAWRLSTYVSTLFLFLAYPVMLSKYDEWLWGVHRYLTLGFLAFWLSLCGWVCARYFDHQNRVNEKLMKDLESISRGSAPIPPTVPPQWLQVWGWANGTVLSALLVEIATVLWSLR